MIPGAVKAIREREETLMNPHKPTEIQLVKVTHAEATLSEKDMLAEWGFTQQEITSLLWLRQWYQTAGSDRVAIVRHLEFLRLLVRSGELEL
jgi:hypothetical protein